MTVYRIEKRVSANGVLHLDALPFHDGDLVEVILLPRERMPEAPTPTTLRGKVLNYVDPTEPVAEADWSVRA